MWAAFWNHVASIVIDLDQLMFTDKAAKDDHTHCCTHGYSPVSVPCIERTVWVHNQCISVTPLLTLDGIVVYELFDGSVTSDWFIQFLREQVVHLLAEIKTLFLMCCRIAAAYKPISSPWSVLILNNCNIHHAKEVQQLVEDDTGMKITHILLYLSLTFT